ncbi:Wadjet anti-phage system protein JetD domain-containing protein [Amycolatopsis cynarae]|uniref:Wadjet anti-phage system protein JetD domain-containing protein n=1 Tax=Amycolatopsis cynarae TaxID=2995223 RepID=UPI003899243F
MASSSARLLLRVGVQDLPHYTNRDIAGFASQLIQQAEHEAALYTDLVEDALGTVRLEQERISYAAIETAVRNPITAD